MSIEDFSQKLSEFIGLDFRSKYINAHQSDAAIQTTLNSLSSNEAFICGAISRVVRGNHQDISEFIDLHASGLPFGLRVHLAHDLRKLWNEWKRSWQTNESCECCQELEVEAGTVGSVVASNLLRQWKEGSLSPEELYSRLDAAVQNTEIPPNIARKLTNYMLLEGGHKPVMTFSDFLQTERVQVNVPDVDLAATHRLFLDSCGTVLTMHSNTGILLEVSTKEEQEVFRRVRRGLQLPVSSPALWWQHTGDGDRLLVVPAVLSAAHVGISDGRTSAPQQPLLLIGESVSYLGGTMDVDVVISVDVFHPSAGFIEEVANGSMALSCCILIEGRYRSGRMDISTRGCSDGASEIAGAENTDDVSSESEADADGHTRINRSRRVPPAMASVRSRYYVVFATVPFNSSHVDIHSIVSLQKGIVLDQKPTTLLAVGHQRAVVAGINGLLGLVDGQQAVTGTAIATISHKNNCDEDEEAQIQQEETTLQSIFFTLTTDSEKPRSESGTSLPLTHAIDATITALSWCSRGDILASGDSKGTVCIWTLQKDSVTSRLLSPPHTIRDSVGLEANEVSPNSETLPMNRIHSIKLAPSGRHVVVGLWDRLLLLSLNPGESHQFIRGSIDIVSGYRAEYMTTFAHDAIHIWRVMKWTEANGNGSGIAISGWKHTNLDEFSKRFGISCNVKWPALEMEPATNAYQQLPTLRRPARVSCEDEEMILRMLSRQRSILTNIGSPPMSPHTKLQTLVGAKRRLEANTRENRSDIASPDCVAQCTTQSSQLATAVQATTVGGDSKATEEKFVRQDTAHVQPWDVQNENCDLLSYDDYDNLVGNELDSDSDSSSTRTASLTCAMTRGIFTPTVETEYRKSMIEAFTHDGSAAFRRAYPILAVVNAAFVIPGIGLVAAALDLPIREVEAVLHQELVGILHLTGSGEHTRKIEAATGQHHLLRWLSSTEPERVGQEFWIDVAVGHNLLCALYLRFCGNKSVAVEHTWQEYLSSNGCAHLRRCSRGLRRLTHGIRKIDETANIQGTLPRQLGYIVGLQEIYARRVGLSGRLPEELGELQQLRVLSMGNNQLCGDLPETLGNLHRLQRIVLHQNRLTGVVPEALGKLGCIVNLAGNIGLHHGPDVPQVERQALVDLFVATKGYRWNIKTFWGSPEDHVSKWYKVGVLASHVHSIVMSSNGMDGRLPPSVGKLTQLRMIELATMPELTGALPTSLCSVITLRRLCICRCSLTGPIPSEIGQLRGLEELQLFGNHLTGKIPTTIGNLTNLKLLSLGEYTGGNDFTSDAFPLCIGRLTQLEALFLANCHIRGPIPSWIGNLTELRQLDLQRNNFSECVPREIGQLTNLLYLNLKDNANLGGDLPVAELAALSRLNRLSLVHCGFTNAEEAVEDLQAMLPRCKIWV